MTASDAPEPEPSPWQRHADFVGVYETFLTLAYPPDGRESLTRSLAVELSKRGVTSILDCAAGTGFPSLDLAAGFDGEFTVHCCDADPRMLAVLAQQAIERGVPLSSLAPPTRLRRSKGGELDPLVVGWGDLDRIDATYDLVMCRGNSLAYADTWSGRHQVLPPELIGGYLALMADRVRRGGYLLIDAPWREELPPSGRSRTLNGWHYEEEVERLGDRREWRVHFRNDETGRSLAFRRYSSLLTIELVAAALSRLDHHHFEEFQPFQLDGERPNYGTLIAHRRR